MSPYFDIRNMFQANDRELLIKDMMGAPGVASEPGGNGKIVSVVLVVSIWGDMDRR